MSFSHSTFVPRSPSKSRTWLQLAIALTFAALLATPAAAATLYLNVQVYDVCDDAGANCASFGPGGDPFFGVETNKIWAQADISVSFTFVQTINSTLFSNIDDTSGTHNFNQLTATYGVGSSSTILDMFLVHTITGASGTTFGEGYLGLGGLAIAIDTVLAYSAAGRLDTIAHEIGHNLGLVPTGPLGGDGSGHTNDPLQLMANGSVRHIPGSLADIAPDGLGYDFLPQVQIDLARTSTLLSDTQVPEPFSVVLVGSGLIAFGFLRRRVSL